MDLAGIYRALRPNTEEFTFFLAQQETSSAMDHILRHKANLSRYKKTELPSGILSDHHGQKLDISNKRYKKLKDSSKLNNSALNGKLIRQKSRTF